ncbi:MAG: hypothetical protein ACE5IT_01320 [bacterium]
MKPQDIGLTWEVDDKLQIGAVFNPGAEVFEDKVILLPRCHKNYSTIEYFDTKLNRERYRPDENYVSEIWPLISEDGTKFERYKNVVIRGDGTDHQDFIYGIEDIRIIKYNRKYLLIGCGKINPPFMGGNTDRVAIYSTEDFTIITYHGKIEPFDSRNAIPFLVNDKWYMLLRFYPNIHLALLEEGIDQLLNPSKYVKYWEKIYEQRNENLLLEAGKYPHEKEKIGPSNPLIKTDRGLLFIYHAVGKIGSHISREYGIREPIERGYSICAGLIDLEDPKKVLSRTKNPIFIPSKPYELYGNNQYPVDVPAVVFPVGGIVANDKLLLYCGAGDKYITLLSCSINNLVNYLLENCRRSQ